MFTKTITGEIEARGTKQCLALTGQKHAAIDLYTDPNAPVQAIYDGKILDIRNFYIKVYLIT